MLNFIYWPISAILWFWHKVFGFIMSPDSGLAWLLSIVFLTFTIRVFLVKPMVNQLRSGRKMQEIQPKLQEVRAKYGNDQAKMAAETQRIYKESGMNPLASCIVPIVQMPVFIGLFHVLRSFNRTGEGMSVEQNREEPNYIFSAADVQSFLDARIFGVPLSSYISMPEDQYEAFSPVDFTRTDIILVALPLVLFCVVMTHLNARLSMNRQRERMAKKKAEDAAKGKKPAQNGPMSAEMMETQMKTINGMMLWFLPATLVITGVYWHIGLLTYMMSNNIWTFFQSKIVFDKMDKEEAAEEEARREAKRASAPAPGARKVDTRSKKQRLKDQQNKARANANAAHPEGVSDDTGSTSNTSTEAGESKVEPTQPADSAAASGTKDSAQKTRKEREAELRNAKKNNKNKKGK